MAQVVRESERTRITRVFLATGTVIRKEPLESDAPQRLRREVAVLERLHGIAGIAQLVQAPQYADSIVLEDGGDRTLTSRPAPLPTGDLIELAVLARAVAGMHRRGVIHRDIAPENVVIFRDGSPCLVDFAVAFVVCRGASRVHAPQRDPGDAAVRSAGADRPDGSVPVDQRADLYALGATLYELATGRPPLGAGDPLRLIHDHLRGCRCRQRVSKSTPCRRGCRRSSCTCSRRSPTIATRRADGLIHDLGGCGTAGRALARRRARLPARLRRRRGWSGGTTRWRR